jgi:DNA-binding protein H-NS
MKRSALVRFVAFLGVLAVLLGYVAYHKTPSPAAGGGGPQVHNTTASLGTRAVRNYIANLKLQRDSMMAKEIATLKSVVEDRSVSAQARQEAAVTLHQDTMALQQDMRIEGILSNQGITEAVAMVGGNGVQIVVGQRQLSAQEVSRIADTATAVTGLPPEAVVIIPRTASS